MDKIKAYYFSNSDRKLGYGDGRKIEVGVIHSVEGEIRICENGLHASVSPFEALQFCKGGIIAARDAVWGAPIAAPIGAAWDATRGATWEAAWGAAWNASRVADLGTQKDSFDAAVFKKFSKL